MKYFIDTEFNGWGGELLSIALVSEDKREFYAELEFDGVYDPWVQQHVVPHFNGCKLPRAEVSQLMRQFFGPDKDITIVADWPDDLKFFFDLMLIGGGKQINVSCVKAVMDRVLSSSNSKVPHHALHDARAIKDCYDKLVIRDHFTNKVVDKGSNF